MNPGVAGKARDWPILYKIMSSVSIVLVALAISRGVTVFILLYPDHNMVARATFGAITYCQFLFAVASLWILHESLIYAARYDPKAQLFTTVTRRMVAACIFISCISIVQYWIVLPEKQPDLKKRSWIIILFLVGQSTLEICGQIFLFFCTWKVIYPVPVTEFLTPQILIGDSEYGLVSARRSELSVYGVRRCSSAPSILTTKLGESASFKDENEDTDETVVKSAPVVTVQTEKDDAWCYII